MLWKLPEIAVPPDTLFYIWKIPITNTLIIAIISALIVLGFFRAALRRPTMIPGRTQNLVEWANQLLLNLSEDVAGKEKARLFFPWVAGIFFFVLINNWWEVIPGVETIGTAINHCSGICLLFGEQSNQLHAWVRPGSTDLNFTIALAVVSVVITQWYGFKILGWKGQLGRYFTLRDGPLGLIVGILEFILEFIRVLSFSFRLFGNLFAGDVLLLVMGFLLPFVGPVPFYFLEVFVGFIQAFVFAFLTLVFLTLGTTGHGHEDHEEEHTAEVAHEEREHAAFVLSHKGQ